MNDIERKENKQVETYNLLASWKKSNGVIASIFVFVVIAIFPLFFHDFYYDISQAKYVFYYGSVILMIIIMLMTMVIYLHKDWNYYEWDNIKKLFQNMSIKSMRKCDWAMLVFVLASVISTFQSKFFYEAFWGNEGRFMGLFLILLYGISFFVITRFFNFKRWHLDAFLIAGMIACLIGILQYFYIDPLGFKKDISLGQYNVFASTFGNINTYTSYVALIVGAATAAFVIEENVVKRRWYLLAVVISLLALITGVSDNAYLSMAAAFGLLPLYMFKDFKGIKKYMLLVTILFTEFWTIDLVNQAIPERVLGINSLFNVIAGYRYLEVIVIALWVITIALYFIDGRLDKKVEKRKTSNIGRWLWLGIITLVLLGIVYILYDVNIAGHEDKYGSLNAYLMFNDDWGSYRGYVWRISREIFNSFSPFQKLFGYGPDTFGIITVLNYYGDMATKYGVIFDSAHNEYLQYLITTGIIGLGAYLMLLITSIAHMFYNSKKKMELIAIAFAVLCYGAQAVVNISVPIVSPIMLTLLMMGVAVGNKEETVEEVIMEE